MEVRGWLRFLRSKFGRRTPHRVNSVVVDDEKNHKFLSASASASALDSANRQIARPLDRPTDLNDARLRSQHCTALLYVVAFGASDGPWKGREGRGRPLGTGAGARTRPRPAAEAADLNALLNNSLAEVVPNSSRKLRDNLSPLLSAIGPRALAHSAVSMRGAPCRGGERKEGAAASERDQDDP